MRSVVDGTIFTQFLPFVSQRQMELSDMKHSMSVVPSAWMMAWEFETVMFSIARGLPTNFTSSFVEQFNATHGTIRATLRH